MSTAAPPGAAPNGVRVAPANRRFMPRLGARSRKIVMIVHLCSAGAWLGMGIVLGLLVVTALAAPPAEAATRAVSAGVFVGWPLVIAALLTLISGIVLGLGSRYGLFSYWWVLIKLVLTIILIVLVVTLLVPSVAELAAGDVSTDQRMLFPPVVSTLALLFATTVSVVKPWGRTAGRR